MAHDSGRQPVPPAETLICQPRPSESAAFLLQRLQRFSLLGLPAGLEDSEWAGAERSPLRATRGILDEEGVSELLEWTWLVGK